MPERRPGATLRTKTGCLTCRIRHKKCNEQRPQCEKCRYSKRVCTWPAYEDLIDRRNLPKTALSSSSKSPPSLSPAPSAGSSEFDLLLLSGADDDSAVGSPGVRLYRQMPPSPDMINSTTIHSDLEADCIRHFFTTFLPQLLLTHTHPSIRTDYNSSLAYQTFTFFPLRRVALACGAINLYVRTGNLDLHQAGMAFYARAVSEVSKALNRIDRPHQDVDDQLLLAVIFLFLYAVHSLETNSDSGRHVSGAAQLMNTRYVQSSRTAIVLKKPMDRIMLESVFYQTFRHAVRHPFTVDFEPNMEFCVRTEQVLETSPIPYLSARDYSPVIGFPLQLQRFIVDVVQLNKRGAHPDPTILQNLERQLDGWMTQVLDTTDCSHGGHRHYNNLTMTARASIFNQHSTSLHILAASLLLDWVKRSCELAEDHVQTSYLPPTNDSWQIHKALQIMNCPQVGQDWVRNYLGSWPTLIFGYAVEDPEHIAVLRNDLQQRFAALFAGEDLLILRELEEVWRMRGLAHSGLHQISAT